MSEPDGAPGSFSSFIPAASTGPAGTDATGTAASTSESSSALRAGASDTTAPSKLASSSSGPSGKRKPSLSVPSTAQTATCDTCSPPTTVRGRATSASRTPTLLCSATTSITPAVSSTGKVIPLSSNACRAGRLSCSAHAWQDELRPRHAARCRQKYRALLPPARQRATAGVAHIRRRNPWPLVRGYRKQAMAAI